MPFPLGKRTSSIQTQSGARVGTRLGRTISLPADDDDLAGSARQHQASKARAANLAAAMQQDPTVGNNGSTSGELPFPATTGQKLKFKDKQRMKVSWGRVSRRLTAGECCVAIPWRSIIVLSFEANAAARAHSPPDRPHVKCTC